MNSNMRDTGPRARSWPWRPGIQAAAVVAIVLLAAACGGGAPAGSGGSSAPKTLEQKLVAYSQCMRSHGVPNFPDPNSQGAFNGSGLNMNSAQMQSARNACKGLVASVAQGLQAQDASHLLRFTQCMRAHGVPNYPDPNSNGQLSIPRSINPQSPTVMRAQQACQSLMPGLGQQSGG